MLQSKHAIATLICLALSVGAGKPVQAGDDLAKALIGAIVIGGMAAGAANAKNNQPSKADRAAARRQQKAAAAAQAAQVQAAKELQSALNYFGFNAGPVDGAPGQMTREAVAAYQGTLGNPATGEITDFERSLLLEAKTMSEQNPVDAQRMASTNPYGLRGIPAALRDYKLGIQPAAVPPAPVDEPIYEDPEYQADMEAAAEAAADAAEAEAADTPPEGNTGMASFGTPTAPERSINQHCTQVNALTTANGSLSTAAAMPDPALALNEQFCLTRSAAMPEGKKAAEGVAATQEQIDAQCGRLKSFVLSKAGDIGTQTPDDVLTAVSTAITAEGQKPEETQLAGRICLGEGYRIDDAGMAMAAALALTASGQKPYAETIGHHLREGFGTKADAALGKTWLTYALDAQKAGDAAVFLPGMAAERSAILTAAIAAP